MEMMKRAIMENVSLNFLKEVCGSEKQPETEESGGEQKQSHGCCFYDLNGLYRLQKERKKAPFYVITLNSTHDLNCIAVPFVQVF